MHDYQHVAQAVFGRPWLIQPEMLETIARLVSQRVAGGRLTDDEIAARVAAGTAAAGPRSGSRTIGAVGVIPIYGVIMPRASLMTAMSGGTGVDQIRANIRQALDDETVGSILLDFDSPGGAVDGIEELANEIRAARGRKPIVALADYSMASAAYYLGSQADEVVASPSAQVGWIGTVQVHREYSKMDAEAGVTTTIFRSPDGKYGANEYEPLSDKARAELQQTVQDYATQFEQAVARGRGVSVATVRADFGQGGGLTATRAKAVGLVDSVETFDEVVRRMAAGKVDWPRPARTGAAAEWRATEDLEDAPGLAAIVEATVEAALDAADPGPAMELAIARAKARQR